MTAALETAPTTGTRRRNRAIVALGTVLVPVLTWVITVQVLGIDVTVPAAPGSTDRIDLALGPVAFMSAASALAGWAFLAVLERFFAKALTIWTWVAGIVFVVTLPWAPGFTVAERSVLFLLHLAVAAVLIPGLRRTAAPR